jgi:hypothetical protein
VVERLYILKGVWQLHWEGNIENNPARWLELLRPFTAVKGLYISREFATYIASALQELVGKE